MKNSYDTNTYVYNKYGMTTMMTSYDDDDGIDDGLCVQLNRELKHTHTQRDRETEREKTMNTETVDSETSDE